MVKQLIYLFLFLALCPGSTVLYAREDKQQKIDSILKLLPHAKEDSNKLEMLLDLIDQHLYYHTEDALPYVQPCLQLADRLHQPVDMINARLKIGRLYWRLTQFDHALIYHRQALNMALSMNDEGLILKAYTHIGQDYADAGNYPAALTYFTKVEQLAKKAGKKHELQHIYNLISWVYTSQGNYPKSSEYNLKFVELSHDLGDRVALASGLNNLAEDNVLLGKDSMALLYYDSALVVLRVDDKFNYTNSLIDQGLLYQRMKDYKHAMANFSSAFNMATAIKDMEGIIRAQHSMGNLCKAQGNIPQALEHYQHARQLMQSFNDLQVKASLYLDMASCYLLQKQVSEAGRYLDTVKALSEKLQSDQLEADYHAGRELLDSMQGSWKDAYLHQKQHIRLRDQLFNDANTKKIMQVSMQYEYDKKQADLKVIQDKKDMRQRTIRNSIVVALVAALLFLLVVYRQRNKIAKERARSDELLLNILPEEVAGELKDKGSADARYFKLVTVMFTDFKDFTRISEKLSPTELVSEIHTCFKAFDEIITHHTIEKIKTIGDAYMCAGGLPVANSTHAIDVVRAALEIQQFMHTHCEARIHAGKEPFEIRIGIHTGPVVAGIVGVKKFAYDIWGDTVNLASRMESGGETGKVNISGSTYELVKDHFSCTHRGKIQVKGKGGIDMYFVNGPASAS